MSKLDESKKLMAISWNKKIKLYQIMKSWTYSFYVMDSKGVYKNSWEYNISKEVMTNLLSHPLFQEELNNISAKEKISKVYENLLKKLVKKDELKEINLENLFDNKKYQDIPFKEIFIDYLNNKNLVTKQEVIDRIYKITQKEFEYIWFSMLSPIVRYLWNSVKDWKNITLKEYEEKRKDLSDIIYEINVFCAVSNTKEVNSKQALMPDYTEIFDNFIQMIWYKNVSKNANNSTSLLPFVKNYSYPNDYPENCVFLSNDLTKEIILYSLYNSNRYKYIWKNVKLWVNYKKNYKLEEALSKDWANFKDWLSTIQETTQVDEFMSVFSTKVLYDLIIKDYLFIFEQIQRLTNTYFQDWKFLNSIKYFVWYSDEKVNDKQEKNQQEDLKKLKNLFLWYEVNLKLYNINPEDVKQNMKKKIIGQDFVLDKIADKLNSIKIFWKQPWRPLASMLFAGPTWVWKSEIAKLLSKEIFGTDTSLVTINLSQYQWNDAWWLANQLTGSQTWYIWSDKGGDLVNKIDEDPRRVVLFDELDKIDPNAMDIFMLLLDEWKLYNNKTWTYTDFSNSVLIFTTNFWAELSLDPSNDNLTVIEKEKIIRNEIIKKWWMKPEFLNRFKDLVLFNRITESVWKDILEYILKDKSDMSYKTAWFEFEFTQTFKDKLYKEGYSPKDWVRYIKSKVEDVINNLVNQTDIWEKTEFIFSLNEKGEYIVI